MSCLKICSYHEISSVWLGDFSHILLVLKTQSLLCLSQENRGGGGSDACQE